MIKTSLFFLIISVILTGCSLPEATTVNQSASSVGVSLQSLTLVSYTSSKATLNVIGSVPFSSVSQLSTLTFYTNSLCTGAKIGSGLANLFSSTGLKLEVLLSQSVDIFVSMDAVPGCFYLTDYSFIPGTVPNAQLIKTEPTSPSFDVSRPMIFTTAPANSVVNFYSDTTCQQFLVSGTAEALTQVGVRLNLNSNQTNSVFAQVVDALNAKSTCSHLTDYVHSTEIPLAPVYNQTFPTSPNNISATATLKGSAVSGIATVKLYNDSGCSVNIGEGTRSEFNQTGVSFTVLPNINTTVYARGFNSQGQSSLCTFMTNYLYDTVAPTVPVFSNSVPVTPTRLTIYPMFYGQASSDTAVVKFYNSVLCLDVIGHGTRNEFQGSLGVAAGMRPNSITSVYAKSFDAAGNSSTCTFFVNYKHNTIPPDPPLLTETNPLSPNNISATPFLIGQPSNGTTQLHFFSDEVCALSIGSGSATDFVAGGIQVNTPNRPESVNLTALYVKAEDEEGNLSDCDVIGNYAYSTAKAIAPVFVQSLPQSPSRFSITPIILGSAHSSVSLVTLFSDSLCTQTLGSANRSTFTTQGIQLNLSQNTSTAVYAKSSDVYGNTSDCVYLTEYIHDNIQPIAPQFLNSQPASPNNLTSSPYFSGSILTSAIGKPLVTSEVAFYDSFLCINRIGIGSPSDFTTTGIAILSAANTLTNVYAMAIDSAGNRSQCTFMSDYVYSDRKPGKPQLGLLNPGTPSFSKNINIKGTLDLTNSIVGPASVTLFKNASCSQLLQTGTINQFLTTGLNFIVNDNSVTSIYAYTTDVVGTQSDCQFLIDFTHTNLGPSGLNAQVNADGTVFISWQPDMIATPSAKYIVKRSKTSGGPYTVLSWANSGNSYIDDSAENGTRYYYVVASTNSTGQSLNSDEVSIVPTANNPQAPLNVSVSSGDTLAFLSWTTSSSEMFYKILRSNQRGGPYIIVNNNYKGSQFVDTQLTNGQIYYYVVIGSNLSGDSLQSNEVNVMPMPPPAAPQNLKLSKVLSHSSCGGGAAIVLTWTKPSYFSGFSIYRGFTSGSLVNVASTNLNSFVECANSPALLSDRVVYYSVAAQWGQSGYISQSDLSNPVNIFSAEGPTVNLNPGHNEIYLSWTALSFAQSYQIWRSTISGWPSENYTLINGNYSGTIFVDTNVVNGQNYFYVVIANYTASSEGWPSAEKAAIPSVNPSAPESLVVVEGDNKMPRLSWKAPSHYNKFNIYRSVDGGPFVFSGISTTNTFVDGLFNPGLYSYYVTAAWGSFETAPTGSVSYRYGQLTFLPTVTVTAMNINLSWTALNTAISYNVYRAIKSDGPFVLIANTTAVTYANSTTNPVANPAVSGQGYFYRIQPVFSGGAVGQFSQTVSGMLTGSNTVSGLTVVATTSNSISLAWADLRKSNLTYFVYRSNSLNGTYSRVMSSTSSQALVSNGISFGLTYFFKVADSSCALSCLSNAVSATAYDAPQAPILKGGHNLVNIYGTNVGATSYSLLRSTDMIHFSVVVSGLGSTNYDDLTAVNGVTYYYKVMATYPNGSQLTSAASLPVTPGIIPIDPLRLFVIDNTDGSSVTLGWANVQSASDYVVFYSTNSGGPWIASQTISNSPITVNGLSANTDYYFVVRSRMGFIESANSSELIVRPTGQPTAPSLQVNTNSISISWSAIPGAASYKIMKSTDNYNFSTLVSNLTNTNHVDSAVLSTETYYYKLISYAASGAEMAPSLTAGPVSVQASVAPSGLIAESVNPIQVKLSWTFSPSTSVSAYKVYRSTVSGGPYSLINVIGNLQNSYVDGDAALVASQDYYYVVSSVDANGLESVNSNESAVQLTTGPVTIAATNSGLNIDVSWAAVPGASQYKVYRSLVSGGPYGELATIGSTSYLDSQINNNTNYYYVVAAIFANGNKSIYSSEAHCMGLKTMNLRVPIEIIDQGLASSNVSDVVFERSRTSLETTAYDGIVTYDFEVVATNNQSSSDATVQLVNESETVVSQIIIPANSDQPYRLTATMSPVPGFHTYRIKLLTTDQASDLQVYSARIWVNQVDASKTKIYYPLMSAVNSPVFGDLYSPLGSTQNTTLQVLSSSSDFIRNTSNLSSMPQFNAWEFESLVSSYGSKGVISLFNVDTGQTVDSADVTFDDQQITLFNSSFNEGASQFATAQNNHRYKVALKCYHDCDLGLVNVYKAGLWVRLENLTKAEIWIRNSTQFNGINTVTVADKYRAMIDLTQFTNPVMRFRATARVSTDSGSQADINLVSNGSGPAADHGLANLNQVANSGLTFNQTAYVTQETGPLNIFSLDRFLTEINPVNGSVDLKDSYLIMRLSH